MATGPAPIRLAVVELHHHADLLGHLCRMLDTPDFRLQVLTRPPIWRLAEPLAAGADIDLHLQGDGESTEDFLRGQRERLDEQADIILFNTLESHHRLIKGLDLQPPLLVRVHNCNAELMPWRSLRLHPLTFLASLQHAIRRGLLGGEWAAKRAFFREVDGILLANENITDYVRGRQVLPDERILPPVLPLCPLGEELAPDPASGTEFTVVVPGIIDRKRKDYAVVLEAFRSLVGRTQAPLHLHLLGKPSRRYGRRMLRAFESLRSEGLRVTTHRSYLEQQVFDAAMRKADLLLAPTRIATHHSKYREYYGRTKVSGIENDILRYRKPAVIPPGYALPRALEPVCERYRDARDLAEIVLRHMARPAAADFSALESYRAGHIAAAFAACCRDLVLAGRGRS